jgi:membrane protease YdiL (CAAX protease family)
MIAGRLSGIPYFAATYGMTRYDHFLRLMVLVSMVLAGLVLTAAASIAVALAGGMSIAALQRGDADALGSMSAGLTRFLLAVQHLFLFILPALATVWLFHRPAVGKPLDLDAAPRQGLVLLAILFLLASFPLVNLSYQLNALVPMPEWASALESEAEATLRRLLEMPSAAVFMANLLVIAILPGIGEELLFRGVVQKHAIGIFRSATAGIWVTSVVFSAIHFQFEGFLPRLVLGLVLGYLYHWTRNLWVPIAAHAFNNGLQVAIIYATGMDVTEFDRQSTDTLPVWLALPGTLLMYFLYRQLIKRTPDEPAA